MVGGLGAGGLQLRGATMEHLTRRDLEDHENRIRFMLDKRTSRVIDSVKAVGIWQAVAVACITSALTTGAVMFMWGIFR